ncbi:hypothetical protein [Rhizobium sp. ARZ01]|uniref:hypothetical protein n=1 Tax=Rhizobium sp. ARZ01 TaxID=2769313 RepID=UPI001FF02089|nr:hypothetical protein [Rhizobium sp. ARZ01]
MPKTRKSRGKMSYLCFCATRRAGIAGEDLSRSVSRRNKAPPQRFGSYSQLVTISMLITMS